MNWKSLACSVAMIACLVMPAGAEESAGSAQNSKASTQGAFGESDYRVGPEDVLEVFVWREPELSTTVVVRPDGKISLPLISELEAQGMTAKELQEEVTTRLRKYVANPVVNVIVKEINSPNISVLGQVRRPDRYRIKQRITVLEAVALAGGFTEFAKRDRVTIIRNSSKGKERIQVDLRRAVREGGSPVYYLEPSDTVYVD
jgi:polysaccharide biosynthesis/export protein